MFYVVGNIIRQPWLYLDVDGKTPLTGQTTPANITFDMRRYTPTGSLVATETITFPETATLGYYDIVFTPANSGVYSMFLHESAGMEREWPFSWEVVSAGAAYLPSYANAFCAESDVERWLQKSIDSTTSPSDTETAGFAQAGARVLQSLCASFGFAVTPATITPGSILEALLREANAVWSAMQFELAQQLRVSPNRSDRIDYLLGVWQQYYGQGPFEGTPGAKPAGKGYIEVEVRGNLASLASDHIISGDTVAASSSGAPTDTGIAVSMRDVY